MGHSKPGKPKSKRVPVRLRNKIQKASAAKQRKARKDGKKNPEWRSRVKKDPGIPNLFPYKDRLLAEVEEKRRLKAEDLERRKDEARTEKKEKKLREKSGEQIEREVEARMEGVELDEEFEEFEDMDEDSGDDNDANPMAALLASAKARAAEYEQIHNSDDSMDEEDEVSSDDDDGAPRTFADLRPDGSRKAFDKIFKAVIDAADVVLYVLDARDPEGTRSQDVERSVMAAASGGKRLILILNKIDLVPPKVLQSWLVHLRRYFPTLPLRASGPAPNAQTFNHKQLTVQSTSTALFKALKSYAASQGMKRAISVGVIGYPNVGKSSVINALLSRLGNQGAACPVGAEAGVTTSLREVKIDNKLKLLDSPGIVFPSTNTSTSNSKQSKIEQQAQLILLNAIPPKQIDDPIPAVTLLLKRLSSNPDLLTKLMAVYGLPPLMTSNGDPTTDFLVQVARKRGRLSKGGVPNLISAAMTVVTDWRDGRIVGWSEPPELKVQGVGGAETGDQKEIVKEWAEEFKIEGLWGSGVVAEGDAEAGDEDMEE